MFIALIASQF